MRNFVGWGIVFICFLGSCEVRPPSGKLPIQTQIILSDTLEKTFITKGKALFRSKCTTCHSWEQERRAPALKGVTRRRTPQWIMNFILAPEIMLAQDSIAKTLLARYQTVMSNPRLSREEARALLEYFRYKDI